MKDLRFGIQSSARYYSPTDWNDLISTTLYCEELGYDSIWFGDHLTTGGGSRFEVWTILSALSALTKKIRLGTLVLCNNLRNPALLAKMAATLDIISQGRLEFGIGSGSNQEEHEAYGYPFQKPPIRIARMREGLEIMKKMWTEDRPSFDGKYYHVHNVVCDPKPLQKPHPPITIGGSGENLTLKAVAAYADWWNARSLSDEYKHKLDLLRKYCARIGRDYDNIDKTFYASMDVYQTEDALIEAMKELYQYGMDRRFRSWDTNWSFDEWVDFYQTNNLIGTPDECLDKIRQFMDIGVTLHIQH